MTDDYESVAEYLAHLTDRPESDFRADGYDIPDFEDQEIEVDE